MSAARQPADRVFSPGELVPFAGIYSYLHANGCGAASEIVLLDGEVFPHCRQCGGEGNFRLLRGAPHISEDADFYE